MIECGTLSASQQHYTRGETLCEPCRQARREYDRKHRYAKTLGGPVRIPAVVLAELYLTASIDAQKALESVLPADKIARIVARYDEMSR